MICDVNFKIRGLDTSDPEKLELICAHLRKIIDAALAMTPEDAVDGYDCTSFNIEEVKI